MRNEHVAGASKTSPATPVTSQPAPSAGLITLYLALPAHASSAVNDALASGLGVPNWSILSSELPAPAD
jgi:hypothetical protein